VRSQAAEAALQTEFHDSKKTSNIGSYMRFLTLSLILSCALAGQLMSETAKKADAASADATFNMYMGRFDKGTETFKIAKKNSRYVLTSTVSLQKYGETISSEQEQELASDWSPLHYVLKTKMAKQERTTEASVVSKKIQMHSASGSDVKNKTVDLHSPALIFDSVAPSQFQVLMNEYTAAHIQQPLNFQLLVPQVMAEFSGTVTPSGSDKGTLKEHPVELRKYTLVSRGANLQIWTDKKGALMRVSLPSKRTEFVREGFKMDGILEQPKPKSIVMLR
jgi:hypothetical protein